jgi:hypothetical protein
LFAARLHFARDAKACEIYARSRATLAYWPVSQYISAIRRRRLQRQRITIIASASAPAPHATNEPRAVHPEADRQTDRDDDPEHREPGVVQPPLNRDGGAYARRAHDRSRTLLVRPRRRPARARLPCLARGLGFEDRAAV